MGIVFFFNSSVHCTCGEFEDTFLVNIDDQNLKLKLEFLFRTIETLSNMYMQIGRTLARNENQIKEGVNYLSRKTFIN